jgi:hypothetical protein
MDWLLIVITLLALFVGCVIWLVVHMLRGLEAREPYRKRSIFHREPWEVAAEEAERAKGSK